MTKRHTHWDDDTIGVNAAGWTIRGGGAPTFAPAYGVVAIKKRYLPFTTDSTADYKLISVDAVDGDANRANFDICTLLSLPLTTTEYEFIYARGQGAGTATDFYRVWIDHGGSGVHLQKRVASGAAADIVSAGFTFDATKHYYVRFSGQGTQLAITVWASTDVEPASTLSTLDSSITAAGWIGLGARHTSLTGKIAAFNFLTVGTGGDVAPRPITNVEYTAWLNSETSRRCTLAEFSATGYDSSGGGSPTTYTKTVKMYVADKAYTSKAWDSPANTPYRPWLRKAPTFSRQMGTGLRGKVTVGFGEVIIANDASTAVGGDHDNLLRIKWMKNYYKQYFGDPSWPTYDFRTVIFGRLGQPMAAGTQQDIHFPVYDLSEQFSLPVQRNTISTAGTFQNRYRPLLIGFVPYHEPPKYDENNLKYWMHDGALTNSQSHQLTDNGVAIYSIATLTIASVSGNVITTTTNHGMVVGWRIVKYSGTFPTPMAGLTEYWVQSTPAANTFTVSTTNGGAVLPLTSTTAGAVFNAFAYDVDYTNGIATLVSTPAGRIVGVGIQSADMPVLIAPNLYSYWPANMYDWLLFTKVGLSANFRDAASFATLLASNVSSSLAAGIWVNTDRHTTEEILDKIAQGTNTWYGWTPDGLFQVGRLNLPASTAVQTLTKQSIAEGTLQLVNKILPIDFSVTDLTYNPRYFASGPLPTGKPEYLVDRDYLAKASNSAPAVPIDTVQQGDVQPIQQFDTILSDSFGALSEQIRLQTLFGKQIGVFKCKARLAAMERSIGETVQLTHPRKQWKEWGGTDPSSPDNTSSIDSRPAVVAGIEVDFSGSSAHPVTLTLYRQIPGYFPEANLT